MNHVYIIRSVEQPRARHSGTTANMDNRLTQHNQGRSPPHRKYTAHDSPLGVTI
jgi:predicted GIY-YIG superfamily endonuclease